MPHESIDHYLEFITETAYLAGRLTLAHFRTGIEADFKADNTPVTIADRQAEELIRQRIESSFPRHAILGEEFGESLQEHVTHRWIIDPIDGTKAFIRGVPLYAVLIGLEIEGQVEVGCAYFPALDEIIYAASGRGCWVNGRRAWVSRVEYLREAYVAYTTVRNFEETGRQAAWRRLQAATYHQVGWSDAYGYLLAATGRVEIMLDPIMNTWDSGPFPPIFRESGGYFGDWLGNPTIHNQEALATSQVLLPQVIQTLAG